MRIPLVFAGFATMLSFGCKHMVNEREARGTLTVNRAAVGNEFLEVPDKSARLTRFIRPGKKIIEINPGWSTITFNVLDSHRVRLATLNIPKKLYSYDDKTDTFTMKTSQISDADAGGHIIFDIVGKTQSKILRVEHVSQSTVERCQANCNGKACDGRIGNVWKVVDYRNDYTVNFMLKGTNVRYAQFTARGETLTESHLIRTSDCVPRSQVFESENNGAFQ